MTTQSTPLKEPEHRARTRAFKFMCERGPHHITDEGRDAIAILADYDRLERSHAELVETLEQYYLALLSIPYDSMARVFTDTTRAALRDMIATAKGCGIEDVQDHFEARAAIAAAEKVEE